MGGLDVLMLLHHWSNATGIAVLWRDRVRQVRSWPMGRVSAWARRLAEGGRANRQKAERHARLCAGHPRLSFAKQKAGEEPQPLLPVNMRSRLPCQIFFLVSGAAYRAR